ncbi:unnamed protein product [Rotaria sp. Silwood2]|nr:unnamed protein product [Rotaria sp. Silwood2]CAF3919350.1 unnamed protein product [Rotaria sp. Silwood2]
MTYITRFREYIKNSGIRAEKLEKIKEFMLDEFYKKRAIKKEAVHGIDSEIYAIQKARKLNWDTCKASQSFIKTFKKENRISSRRYNKLITRTSSTRKVSSLEDAQNCVESKRPLISIYSSREILNSDHCSFHQEHVPPRTLSYTGKRTTEVAVKKKNNTTHSYTVQPVTSADGRLLDKFLLILQEKDDQFGKRVQKDLVVSPNVVIQASKSGRSSDEKHRTFLNEVVRPLVSKKFLLLLDSWKTQANLKKFRAVFPNQDSQLLIFPEGSTGHIQTQDLSLFRSWRFIHKEIEHYTHINRTEITITDRQCYINIQSVIHNQLSASQFENLIKSGLIRARIINETSEEPEKPKDDEKLFIDKYSIEYKNSYNNDEEINILIEISTNLSINHALHVNEKSTSSSMSTNNNNNSCSLLQLTTSYSTPDG